MTPPLPADCAECRPLLSAFLDNEVSAAEQQPMMRHLTRCAACQEAFALERALMADLRSLPMPARDTSALHARLTQQLAMQKPPPRMLAPDSIMLPALGTLTLIGMGWGVVPCSGPTAALCLSGAATSLGHLAGHFDAHVLLFACGVAMGQLSARLMVRHWPVRAHGPPFPRRIPLRLVAGGVGLLLVSLDPWVGAIVESSALAPTLHLALHALIFGAGLSIAGGLVFLNLLRLPPPVGENKQPSVEPMASYQR